MCRLSDSSAEPTPQQQRMKLTRTDSHKRMSVRRLHPRKGQIAKLERANENTSGGNISAQDRIDMRSLVEPEPGSSRPSSGRTIAKADDQVPSRSLKRTLSRGHKSKDLKREHSMRSKSQASVSDLFEGSDWDDEDDDDDDDLDLGSMGLTGLNLTTRSSTLTKQASSGTAVGEDDDYDDWDDDM